MRYQLCTGQGGGPQARVEGPGLRKAQLGRSGGADGAGLGTALKRALVRDFVLAT